MSKKPLLRFPLRHHADALGHKTGLASPSPRQGCYISQLPAEPFSREHAVWLENRQMTSQHVSLPNRANLRQPLAPSRRALKTPRRTQRRGHAESKRRRR